MQIVGHGWDEADFHRRFVPVIHQMMADRAWIINSYAQVEYLAADLIVKSRRFPEYSDVLDKPVPFGIVARVQLLTKLCLFGPLAQYGGSLVPLLAHVLELEETRHFFTHGFLSVHIEENGRQMAMHLRRYVPPKKGEVETKAELLILPNEMTRSKERWVRFAQNAVETFRFVYTELKLEAHDVTDGNPAILT
jgi:hypothetical protein